MKKLLIITLLTLPITLALAQEQAGYTPMVGLPGIGDGDQLSTQEYINALYILSISLAAFLAVIKLILAGVKYVLSDVVTDKGQAKKDIRTSLLGLALVLGAVILLNTINPQLTNLQIFRNAPSFKIQLERHQLPEISCRDVNVDCECPDCEFVKSSVSTTTDPRRCGTCVPKSLIPITPPSPEEGTGDTEDGLGKVVRLTGGSAEMNQVINAEVENGRKILSRSYTYQIQNGNTERNNNITDCRNSGGSYYQVFLSGTSERFVCYQ